jgi:lysophospholipase L1-like esterase
MRVLVLACAAFLLLSLGAAAPARASAVSLPNSMASAGDSITRAFDVNWSHLLSDSPQYSWSTGDSTSVDSQYRRLLALNPAIAGHEHNDAKTGAKMADLDGQVLTAASQGVGYLTILMGANDLCTSSASAMTPTATFRAEFQTALQDFIARDPSALVYVSSLPNLYQLWSVLHGYWQAETTWTTFGICQSMLSIWNSNADRQAVVTQEAADNQALQSVCAQFAHCRWDNYAGYNFEFPAGDISTVDYFHPNLQGQNAIAALTWTASYWGS